MLRHQILSFIGTEAITVKLLYRLDDSRTNLTRNIFQIQSFVSTLLIHCVHVRNLFIILGVKLFKDHTHTHTHTLSNIVREGEREREYRVKKLEVTTTTHANVSVFVNAFGQCDQTKYGYALQLKLWSMLFVMLVVNLLSAILQ